MAYSLDFTDVGVITQTILPSGPIVEVLHLRMVGDVGPVAVDEFRVRLDLDDGRKVNYDIRQIDDGATYADVDAIIEEIRGAISAMYAGGGGSGITALTGDVTAAGTGSVVATIANNAIATAMIQNDAVTYAKMQNVGAESLVGNPTIGTANPTGIPIGSGLAISTSTLVTANLRIDGVAAIGYVLDARNGTTDLVGVVVFDLSAYSAIQFVSAMAVGTSVAFPGTILDPTLATYTLRFLDLAGVPLVSEPVVFTFLGLPV